MILSDTTYWHHSRQVSWPLYPAQNRHISPVPVRTLLTPKLCIKAYRPYGAPSLPRLPYINSPRSRSRTEKFPKKFFAKFPQNSHLLAGIRRTPQNPLYVQNASNSAKPRLCYIPQKFFQKIFSNFFPKILRPRALASIGDASKCAKCYIARNFSQKFFPKIFGIFNLYETPPVRS